MKINIFFKGFIDAPTEIYKVQQLFKRIGITLLLSTEKDAYIKVYLTSAKDMKRLFNESHLQGLSVCDMETRKVYIHAMNWERTPADSDIQSHRDYRILLLVHEILHGFGLPHIDNPVCSTDPEPAPSMFQPSKSYARRGNFIVPKPLQIVLDDNEKKFMFDLLHSKGFK